MPRRSRYPQGVEDEFVPPLSAFRCGRIPQTAEGLHQGPPRLVPPRIDLDTPGRGSGRIGRVSQHEFETGK
jgi:hypothetical protein